MKIYISADIEGVSGIATWDETARWKPDYVPFNAEMMKEVHAACEGANKCGATEIWIKDAHGDGNNLRLNGFPINTRLIRAFNGHPFCMMQELDDTFDAILMIGYHSYAGSGESPLAHTLHPDIAHIKINGEYASEFLINAYTASLLGVPVVFVSGDYGICKHVKGINKHIETVDLNKGIGETAICIDPQIAFDHILKGVETALKSDINQCHIPLPKWFDVEVAFISHTKAYRGSFYPDILTKSANKLLFSTDDYFEVLRMLSFVL